MEDREDDSSKSQRIDHECPVCLTTQPFRDIFTTKCDHAFCKSCVVELLQQDLPQALKTSCPVCRQEISAFDTIHADSGRTLMNKPSTIYGGVYVQGGTEGLASYHFSEEESYISYSAAPPTWRLDNDSPPPVKKPFLNATYDPSIRTFRAIVDWSSVNFGGDAKWIYRMAFSEDFTRIDGGEVISYGAAGEKRRWHAYEQDLFYVRQMKQFDFEL